MTFEVCLAGRTLFHAVTGERAAAGQADWIRRKRNTVLRFGRSSYSMGLELETSGLSMEARHNLPIADFAMHGGGLPLTMIGAGCIGTVVCKRPCHSGRITPWQLLPWQRFWAWMHPYCTSDPQACTGPGGPPSRCCRKVNPPMTLSS